MKVRTEGMTLLAAWRKREGLTQGAAGGRLGFSDVAVSQWESGDRRPNIDSAVMIEEGTSGKVPASSWRRPKSDGSEHSSTKRLSRAERKPATWVRNARHAAKRIAAVKP